VDKPVGEDEKLNELAMEWPQKGEDGSNNSENEGYSYGIGDEEDEDLRPAKRLKRSAAPGNKILADHVRHRPPRSLFLTAERGDMQSKQMCQSTPKADKQLCSPRGFQSPSPTTGSIPIAEYQEWDVRGIFNYTRIEDHTTLDLELHTINFREHFELLAPLKAIANKCLSH